MFEDRLDVSSAFFLYCFLPITFLLLLAFIVKFVSRTYFLYSKQEDLSSHEECDHYLRCQSCNSVTGHVNDTCIICGSEYEPMFVYETKSSLEHKKQSLEHTGSMVKKRILNNSFTIPSRVSNFNSKVSNLPSKKLSDSDSVNTSFGTSSSYSGDSVSSAVSTAIIVSSFSGDSRSDINSDDY
jgi:hypothetical protein